MEDFHLNAAKVNVTEGTDEPICYNHPSNSNIKFWDLPGITHPSFDGDLEKYCKNVPLDTYDTYLIFSKDRFTVNDLRLAERIRSTGKRFFFIRARIDQDVDSARRSRKHLFDENATLDAIRRYLSQNLIERGLLDDEQHIFLISNHYPAKYQFGELTRAIVSILPQRQRESFILTLDNAFILSRSTLKEKVEVCKKRIKYVATASAVAAAVPIPGVALTADIVMIKREIYLYINQLGLPQEGTQRFLLLNNNTQTQIIAFIAAFGGTTEICELLAAYATDSAVEEFTRCIPFIGIAIASPLSYGATYYFLSKSLERLEELALRVLEEILNNVA